MTLTIKQINAARFGVQKERMSDGAGLYLRLYPSGKKAFQVQVFKEQGGTGRVWVSLDVSPRPFSRFFLLARLMVPGRRIIRLTS